MKCFMTKNVDNPRFPRLSAEVTALKTTERGVSVMCEVMEKYMAESRAEGKTEGKLE